MTFIMESPNVQERDSGRLFDQKVYQGRVMFDKQFYWHLFWKLGWKNVTPEGWGNPFQTKPKQMKKIMLIHHSGFGDFCFISPIIKQFAETYPGIEIHLETNEKGAVLAAGNPYLKSEHISINKKELLPYCIHEFDDVIN